MLKKQLKQLIKNQVSMLSHNYLLSEMVFIDAYREDDPLKVDGYTCGKVQAYYEKLDTLKDDNSNDSTLEKIWLHLNIIHYCNLLLKIQLDKVVAMEETYCENVKERAMKPKERKKLDKYIRSIWKLKCLPQPHVNDVETWDSWVKNRFDQGLYNTYDIENLKAFITENYLQLSNHIRKPETSSYSLHMLDGYIKGDAVWDSDQFMGVVYRNQRMIYCINHLFSMIVYDLHREKTGDGKKYRLDIEGILNIYGYKLENDTKESMGKDIVKTVKRTSKAVKDVTPSVKVKK